VRGDADAAREAARDYLWKMTRKFKICPDCQRPLIEAVKLGLSLWRCRRCDQYFSREFLRAYWQGYRDAAIIESVNK